MPVLSILVPVCNVGQYLEQCLDSIPAQALRDFEVICIDNGSTDSSPAILDDDTVEGKAPGRGPARRIRSRQRSCRLSR